MKELVLYNQARHLVAEINECTSLFDVKEIVNKAEALRAYAESANDQTMECQVAKFKLLALRRMGQLTAELKRTNGENLSNVASSGNRGKRAELAALGITKDQAHKCEKLARLDSQAVDDYMAKSHAAGRAVTADQVIKVLGKERRRQEVANVASYDGALTVDDLQSLKEKGLRFGTIYADPPWRYENQGSHGATGQHYASMSTDDIAELPVSHLAADSCHLHLWTTSAHLFEAKGVMDAWGFKYKSCFVWVKPDIGLGNYYRNAHEYLLLGVRGGGTFLDHSIRSWSQYERGDHSVKPSEVRSMVERVSSGPRLELFGRGAVAGWTVWGNESSRSAFEESVEDLRAA